MDRIESEDHGLASSKTFDIIILAYVEMSLHSRSAHLISTTIY